MHISLPRKIEDKLQFWRRKLLPRTLFFRTMLLIFVPLIVVQIVSVVVFFDGSWSRMGRRLSDGLVDDIKVLMELKKQGMPLEQVRKLAKEGFNITFDYFMIKDNIHIKRQKAANPMVVA